MADQIEINTNDAPLRQTGDASPNGNIPRSVSEHFEKEGSNINVNVTVPIHVTNDVQGSNDSPIKSNTTDPTADNYDIDSVDDISDAWKEAAKQNPPANTENDEEYDYDTDTWVIPNSNVTPSNQPSGTPQPSSIPIPSSTSSSGPTPMPSGGSTPPGGGGHPPVPPIPTPASPPPGGTPPPSGSALPIAGVTIVGAVLEAELTIIKKFAQALMEAKERLDQMSESLAPFNSDLTLAQVMGRIQTLETDIRIADQIGKGLADFTKESYRGSNELKSAMADLIQPFLPEIVRLMSDAADTLVVIRSLIDLLASAKTGYDKLKEEHPWIFGAFETLTDNTKIYRDAIKRIADVLERNEDDDSSDEFQRRLADFLDPTNALGFVPPSPPMDIGAPGRR